LLQNLAPLRRPALHLGGRRAEAGRYVYGARFRIVAFEMRRLDVDAADESGGAAAADAPVVGLGARLAQPPRLPAVHPLAAVGVLCLDPDRCAVFDQVVLRCEEVVVRSDDDGAEAFAGEIDEILKRGAHSSRPAPSRTRRPSSQTRTPRRNVVRTAPRRRRPAYAVSLCRCCRRAGSTIHSASGSKTRRSASQPAAMRPLRERPASAAGAAHIQRVILQTL